MSGYANAFDQSGFTSDTKRQLDSIRYIGSAALPDEELEEVFKKKNSLIQLQLANTHLRGGINDRKKQVDQLRHGLITVNMNVFIVSSYLEQLKTESYLKLVSQDPSHGRPFPYSL